MTTQYPISSEIVEPVMAHILGRLWKQAEEAQTEDEIEAGCRTFYLAAKAISQLGVLCNMQHNEEGVRPAHFSIASSNVLSKVADYVEFRMGFNPEYDTGHPLTIEWNHL